MADAPTNSTEKVEPVSGAPAVPGTPAAPAAPAAPGTPEASKEKPADSKPAGEKEEPKSLLDEATDEAKAAQEADEKRLLDADPATLSEDDKVRREQLIKDKAEKEKQEKDKSKTDVPDKYELKAPEGMTIDEKLVEKVTPVFKEIGLTNEQAQKITNLYAEQIKAISESQDAAFNAFVEHSKQETIKALGAEWKKELAFAAKTRDRFFSKETVEKLNLSGLANDKDLIADIIKIGRSISEDKFVDGKTGIPGNGKSAGQILYPSMTGENK